MAQTPQIMPRYEVEKVENAVVNRRVIEYIKEKDENGKFVKDESGKVMQKREERIVNIAEGEPVYDIWFPQGHQIRVVGDKALAELNLDGEPKLIDMNSGEEVPEGYSSVKSLVQSMTKHKRRAK